MCVCVRVFLSSVATLFKSDVCGGGRQFECLSPGHAGAMDGGTGRWQLERDAPCGVAVIDTHTFGVTLQIGANIQLHDL